MSEAPEQVIDDQPGPVPGDGDPTAPADVSPEPALPAEPDAPSVSSEDGLPAEPDAPSVSSETGPEPRSVVAEPSAAAAPSAPVTPATVLAESVTPATVMPATPTPAAPTSGAPADGGPTHGAPTHGAPADGAPTAAPVSREEWGRVDADGTVYVRTAEGERAIGSWQAGTPAEALEFYGRRYDGLVVEVDLLFTRVRESDVPEKEARSAIDRLRASLVDVAAIGDLAALDTRIAKLDELAKRRAGQARAARAKIVAETRTLKERIVSEAETVGAGSDWRIGGERISALLEEWKAAPRLDRKSDDELWQRFSAARSSFSKRRKVHYAELTSTRDAAKAQKEALVAKAEALASSTDWGSTSDAYRNLMRDWKACGRASRDVDDALWERFKGAQDQFFAARNTTFAAKDAELATNLAAKEALVVEAERLLPVSSATSARAALRGIQDRWETAGSLPRENRSKVESRLAAVESAVREAEEATRHRSNPAARARAQEAVDSILTSIAKFEKQADKARAAGNAKALTDAEDSAAARREWLIEAEKLLAEFS